MNWEIKVVNVEALKGFDKNPRNISQKQFEQLKCSIAKFGLCQPIVVNQDYTVIGGHQRLRSLMDLGEKIIDVYYPDRLLSQKEVEELCIRLNKNNGYFNYDDLANLFEIDDLVDWGFSLDEFQIIDSQPPKEEKAQKNCKMIINFKSPEDLQSAENRISTIVDEFDGASYKVKLPK